jgi:hypothetical protein
MKTNIPEGTEFFTSDAALAARLGLSVRESLFLIRTGQLRPFNTRHDGTFYETSALDAIQAHSPISAGERSQLFASRLLSDMRRQEQDRSGPGGKLRLQLRAIRPTTGVLEGVTALKANVACAGKFVAVDRDGKITDDPGKAVSRLPVWTDNESLRSLVSCAREAGGTVRSGTDHRGDFGGRLGHVAAFRLVDDAVLVDLHLLRSSRNRAIVLETASASPELISLSADGDADFEIRNGRAYLRFKTLASIDVVDQGAATMGLFD